MLKDGKRHEQLGLVAEPVRVCGGGGEIHPQVQVICVTYNKEVIARYGKSAGRNEL